MNWKKIFGWLHLWLGLVAGLIVFIVAVTGAIYAVQPEISTITEPYRFVKVENKPLQPVTVLRAAAEKSMGGMQAFRILYGEREKGEVPIVQFFRREPYFYHNVYVNPYTGEVIKVLDRQKEFFKFILDGHMNLWLPQKIGHHVVGYGTLVFLVIIVSGIVLWWPRNKARLKSSFKVKWGASPKRLNYDLHNVFGFYASWVILFAVLTGLVWSFKWAADTEFWLFSGGKGRPVNVLKSGRPAVKDSSVLNRSFEKVMAMYPEAEGYSVSIPANDSAVITCRAYPSGSQYYNGNYHYFDQHTGAEIAVSYMGKYENASLAEKASRMNYDIHVGSIFGIPGRLLMFLAALITASLPVTGFLIWWGKRKKKGKGAKLPAGNRKGVARVIIEKTAAVKETPVV